MTKEEIKNKIFELKNDEEIRDFIVQRINELEIQSEEKTVGQNYTDSFADYISSKIHYKPAEKFGDDECPNLIYDDIDPYISLLKTIKKDNYFNTLTLFTTVFWEISEYFSSNNDIDNRYFTYVKHKGDKVSIREIKANRVAFCSEKSGLSHNMFKLLGIDSEVVCGARDSEPHAYNLIYPKGYDNFPVVIYDPSFFVSFVNGEKTISCGYYKVLNEEEYKSFKNGEPCKADLTKAEREYRELYGRNGALDDYKFVGNTSYYAYGLEALVKMEDCNLNR